MIFTINGRAIFPALIGITANLSGRAQFLLNNMLADWYGRKLNFCKTHTKLRHTLLINLVFQFMNSW